MAKILFQERASIWLPWHSPVITLHTLHKSCKICSWLHSRSLFCLLPEEDNNLGEKINPSWKMSGNMVWDDTAGFFHQVMCMDWPWYIVIMPHFWSDEWISKQLVRNGWPWKRKSSLLSATYLMLTCCIFSPVLSSCGQQWGIFFLFFCHTCRMGCHPEGAGQTQKVGPWEPHEV